MQAADLARGYFRLAQRDADALHLLAANADIADETVGFHDQQVVEKCLKAVLALHGVAFRKTHDRVELLDLLGKKGTRVKRGHGKKGTHSLFSADGKKVMCPLFTRRSGPLCRVV